jgi:hypothetical protein
MAPYATRKVAILQADEPTCEFMIIRVSRCASCPAIAGGDCDDGRADWAGVDWAGTD